jgi:anti-sigma-K factor RskA
MNAQLEELACLYVLDQLDTQERAAFEASLLESPDLAAVVTALESTLERSIRALPQHTPSPSLLSKIDDRIDCLPGKRSFPFGRWAAKLLAKRRAPGSPGMLLARLGIAALLVAGIGTIAVERLWHAHTLATRSYAIIVGLDPRQSTMGELALPERPHDADARFVQLASLAARFWEKPADLPVKLRSAGEGGRGYALFDPASNQGFIAVQQLPVIGSGKRYHLWMLNTASGQTREAGVLPLIGSNSGLYFFSTSPAFKAGPSCLDFFVTTEDVRAPGTAGPSGKVVLGDQRTF